MFKNLKFVALMTVQLGFVGFLAATSSCGKSTSGGGGTCNVDATASATQKDGDCCMFSINCQPGSICNDMSEDLYDKTKASQICIKVICATDADCDSGKKCSLEKICNSPVCQTDSECQGGTACLGGTCKSAPMASDVTACEIETRSQAIRQGQAITLVAVAKNANGVVLPHISFDWSSSNSSAVAVASGMATGGSAAGPAMLTAKVTGNGAVACSNGPTFNNFPTLGANMSRVILVQDDNGAAVNGATVTVIAGMANMMQMTDATGAATFAMGGALDSITVSKTGFRSITVLSPGTNDIFLPLPKIADDTKAGGFRGSVDISATKHADIQLGLAGPAIPTNLLDFALTSLLGDQVKTVINAPELGLTNQMLNLPGGIMLGLGNKHFTADNADSGGGLRCQGMAPSDTQLGCYVARAPAGPGAGWVLAGQLKLSQVTAIATNLTNAFGMGKGKNDVPIGDILTAVLPLLRTLYHGVAAAIDTTEYDKVPADSTMMVDCKNANQDMYDTKCRGDYAQYQKVTLSANTALGVLSTLNVPTLPNLPKATGCAGAAILVSGAILPGRGILPLGLSAGLDTLKTGEMPDCKVDGIDKPFGDMSPKLSDGSMALSMSPPHDGIEGNKLFLLLLSLDPKTITGSNIQLTALVKRKDSISATETFSDPYLAFPTGVISKAGTFTPGGAIAGANMMRVQIENGNDEWLVYMPAPSGGAAITLPNVATPRALLTAATKAFVQAIKVEGNYSDTFSFGSGKTLDHFVDQVDAFVVQECGNDSTAACTLSN